MLGRYEEGSTYKHLWRSNCSKANKILTKIKHCLNMEESIGLWDEIVKIIQKEGSKELINQDK